MNSYGFSMDYPGLLKSSMLFILFGMLFIESDGQLRQQLCRQLLGIPRDDCGFPRIPIDSYGFLLNSYAMKTNSYECLGAGEWGEMFCIAEI